MNKLADDAELIDMACERTFQVKSLRDLQREALEKLDDGQDLYLIQPIGRGKYLIFQSTPIFFFSGRDAEQSGRNQAQT